MKEEARTPAPFFFYSVSTTLNRRSRRCRQHRATNERPSSFSPPGGEQLQIAAQGRDSTSFIIEWIYTHEKMGDNRKIEKTNDAVFLTVGEFRTDIAACFVCTKVEEGKREGRSPRGVRERDSFHLRQHRRGERSQQLGCCFIIVSLPPSLPPRRTRFHLRRQKKKEIQPLSPPPPGFLVLLHTIPPYPHLPSPLFAFPRFSFLSWPRKSKCLSRISWGT